MKIAASMSVSRLAPKRSLNIYVLDNWKMGNIREITRTELAARTLGS